MRNQTAAHAQKGDKCPLNCVFGRQTQPGLVVSPEILNPESKVGTLNPRTLESGEFGRVNDFFANPDILPTAIF